MIEQATKTQDFLESEDLNLEWFDQMVERTRAFRLLREVEGEYLQPRPRTENKGARIDRLLIPLAKAIEAGWVDGVIGVEGKNSGAIIGRLVSQALDYTRCTFTLPNPPGMMVIPSWIFIYPVTTPRIQMARLTASIVIYPDGSLVAKSPPCGKKRGSR